MAAYVDKGANQTSANNALVIAFPASINANEFLLVSMYIGESGASIAGLTNNSSFMVIHDVLINDYHWVLAWKRASGAEAGSATFSWTNTTSFNEGWMARCSGVYTTGDPFQFSAGTQTTTATHTAPSVNSTYSNSLMLYLAAESNYAAWSTVSGFTEHYDGGAGAFGALQSKTLSATGSTGTAESTSGAGAGQAATLLLFDTSPAGGGSPIGAAAYYYSQL